MKNFFIQHDYFKNKNFTYVMVLYAIRSKIEESVSTWKFFTKVKSFCKERDCRHSQNKSCCSSNKKLWQWYWLLNRKKKRFLIYYWIPFVSFQYFLCIPSIFWVVFSTELGLRIKSCPLFINCHHQIEVHLNNMF